MPLSLTYIAFLILILALMMLPLHITILKNTQKYIHMNYLLYPACSNTEARSPFSLKITNKTRKPAGLLQHLTT